MSIDIAALLNPDESLMYARKIEDIIAKLTPADMLGILTIVADKALRRIKAEHERRDIGSLFIKELQLRVALREYSDTKHRDPTVARTYVELDETEALASSLADCCIVYKYRSILHAVPMAVGAILRDYPKDRDRNHMVLDIIQAAVHRRFRLNYEKAVLELKAKAQPLTDRLKAIRDDRLRCTAVLEMVEFFASLVDADTDD